METRGEKPEVSGPRTSNPEQSFPKVVSEASTPKEGLAGLCENWKFDLVSGLIVFLVALPLCLGIALASGAPPLAGVFSAVIGGLIVSQISGSFITINGPAAGLIVVIVASIDRLGGGIIGYQATLAACVVSGLMLLILGLLRAGELGEFFPPIVVHGLLSAIGIIIICKQFPLMIGAVPEFKEPLELILHAPFLVQNLNPEITVIGITSLTILTLHGSIRNKSLRRIPAPIIVVLVSILLGHYFDLAHSHLDVIGGRAVEISPKFLVSVPSKLSDGICFPCFSAIVSVPFAVSVISITLVQFVESLLSTAAIDKLDPFRRHSNLSKDIAAVGLGSALAGLIGGLPIIAEIVRSTTNLSNGARTRWSNFFHGMFMLVSVSFFTTYINSIPLAALAALLVFTGFKLTSPKVIKEVHEIGLEQSIVFVTTMIAAVTTDLLVGLVMGIVTKLTFHILSGVPLRSLFKANLSISDGTEGSTIVEVKDSAIFSNFVSLKRQLKKLGNPKHLTLDLSATKLVDHTVMERLHQYLEDYSKVSGGHCQIQGLELHKPSSNHLFAARKAIG